MSLFKIFIFISFLTLTNCYFAEPDYEPVLQLPSGPIVGKMILTEWGNQSWAFLGIPYAQPPVNSLRFAPPVPASNWSDPIICQSYKPACPQNSTTSQTKQTSVDEDCLYLNVFAPINCTKDSKCGVIYYVHGGGNEFDSVWNFPQDVLVDNYASRDVIFITSGYRLGVLGFFSTGTPDFPGNMALKDIMLGLKWVKDNIDLFGGDPERVTIMGHSTSAALISLLTLSPRTEGLFNQAVSMSGTGFMPGAIGNSPSPRDKILAEQLGCTNNSEWNKKKFDLVVECLRNVSWEDITQTYLHPSQGPDLSAMGSWPVYDGLNGIFPAPLEVLTKKRRPLRFMIGTVTREFPTYLNDSTILSVYEACLMATVLKGFKNKLAISAACAVHYTKHSYDDSNSYQPDGINSRIDTAVVSVLNDVGIYNPTYEDAKSHTENGGTSFLYEFEYARKGEENFTPYHSYDLTFVTGNHWDRINLTETDQQIRDIYVDLFSNFAKFGNPTPGIKHTKSNPRWYPLGPDGAANYFAINLPAPKNKVSYHYEGNLFWDTLAPAVDQMFTSDKRSGPFVSNLVAIQDAPAAESNSTGANNTALIATIVGVACLIVGIMLAVVGMKMRNRKNKNDSEKKLLLQENLQYQTFQQI